VYCSPAPASAESKERVARSSDLDARRLPLSACSASRLFSAWRFWPEERSSMAPLATSSTPYLQDASADVEHDRHRHADASADDSRAAGERALIASDQLSVVLNGTDRPRAEQSGR
jgi:hypothetical protein